MAPPTHPLMIDRQAWDRQKVVAIVCDSIASCSKSIVTILSAGHDGNTLPGYTAFMGWLAEDVELANQYARAKEQQADYLGEEMLDIADDGRNDFMESLGEDGEVLDAKLNSEHVQRSKLRIETRKWLMGKLRPKKYGDKLAIGGDPDNPIQINISQDDANL